MVKPKFVNVELDKAGRHALLVVKRDMGLKTDAEVMRFLLRQAYNTIPPERRKLIEQDLGDQEEPDAD